MSKERIPLPDNAEMIHVPKTVYERQPKYRSARINYRHPLSRPMIEDIEAEFDE